MKSEGLSRVFSNTMVQKHQFFGNNDHAGARKFGEMGTWSWSSGDSFEALRCSLEVGEVCVENLCPVWAP